MPTAEQTRFITAANQLVNAYGHPLTQEDYRIDFNYYVAQAEDSGALTNLPRARTLGRIAVHTLELNFCEVTTTLSMLNESSGIMPYESSTGGHLMGHFDIAAARDKTDYVWLSGGIYTSRVASWHNIVYELKDLIDIETETEVLDYFSGFDQGLFSKQLNGSESDIVNDNELHALTDYLLRGLEKHGENQPNNF